jgi:flagellar basal-body rod modification protein FlgD
VVRTLAGERNVGAHDFVWDGRNDAGAQLPPGAYTLTAVARASDGAEIAPTISGVGLIKEIDMSNGEPQLTIGARKVGLLEVLGFKN